MSYLSVWNILQSRLWWRLIISIRKDAILLIYKLRKLKYSLVLPIYTEYSIWITIHLTKAPNLFWWSIRHHIRSKGEILDWGKVIGISIFFWSSSKLPHGLMKATQTSVLRRTATKRVVFWVTESNHFTLLDGHVCIPPNPDIILHTVRNFLTLYSVSTILKWKSSYHSISIMLEFIIHNLGCD